jgi:hypothetical protein
MQLNPAVRYLLTLTALGVLMPLAVPPFGALRADHRQSPPLAGAVGASGAAADANASSSSGDAGEVPMDVQAVKRLRPVTYSVRNLLSPRTLQDAIRTDAPRASAEGLRLDLSDVQVLLDGTRIDAAELYGTLYVGPYPFEADETRYAYKRFRGKTSIREGSAIVPLAGFFADKTNSEGWTDGGQVVIRLDLHLARPGEDRPLGVYDTFAWFDRTDNGFVKIPGIVEGPLVHRLTSDHPTMAVISVVTDAPSRPTVFLEGLRTFRASIRHRRHEILLRGLTPGKEYAYRVQVGDRLSDTFTFRAAPEPGLGEVTLAYCGDSREGVGGGMLNYMGINHRTIQRHMAFAYDRGADLFVMGGDLINGYTTVPEDFAAQLHAWKQATAGFWSHRPIYVAMGNHEALLRAYDDGGRNGRRPIRIDRWPYASQSAEGVFAEQFVNPRNAPTPADPRRPSYAENVYSFRYGPMMMIVFNNNYWYSSDPDKVGGSPEGYVLDDQMDWIEAQLAKATADQTVQYVFLCAQEPVIPCGGHVKDAMWYQGNNNVRACTFTDGKLVPHEQGIVEVRNRLVRAVAKCPKVAAVFGSDEHAYSRIWIDKDVPLGEPARDDRDGDGIIDWNGDEPASPLGDLAHGTWYITSGGGGAPFYAEEPTPWNTYWTHALGTDRRAEKCYFSSQENVVLIRCKPTRLQANGEWMNKTPVAGLEVYNPYGELIEKVDNLMAGK